MSGKAILTPDRTRLGTISSHGSASSLHGGILRAVLTSSSPEDDEALLIDDYEDTRVELKGAGHNLTSVLMNPRETVLENLMDEFEVEQSQPLETLSVNDSPLSTASTHISQHFLGTSSSAFSSSSSGHGWGASASSHGGGAMLSSALYTLSPSEMEQLKDSISRMKKLYREYDLLHYSAAARNKAGGGGGGSPQDIPGLRSSSASGEDIAICFREVPDIFFRTDFTLQSPELFNQSIGGALGPVGVVSGVNGVVNGAVVDMSTASPHQQQHQLQNQHQQGPHARQEQLSRFLDLVEVALLKHIWTRSPSFFRALDDIKGLQYQVSEATVSLKRLRNRIQTIDEDVALGAMRIPQMHRRQTNELALHKKLICMQRVLQSRKVIRSLLEIEDYMGALEVIYDAKKMFSEELTGLQCMRLVGNQLDEYDEIVCEIMCNRFVSLAVEWDLPSSRLVGDSLHSNSSTSNSSGSGNRNSQNGGGGGAASNGVAGGVDADDEIASLIDKGAASSSNSYKGSGGGDTVAGGQTAGEALEQLLGALHRVNRLGTALNMYKSRLCDAIKLIVRTCVLEYLSSFDPSLLADGGIDSNGMIDEQSSGSSAAGAAAAAPDSDTPFAQRVRGMSNENFLSCLSMSFEQVVITLNSSELVHKFIVERLSDSNFGIIVSYEANNDVIIESPPRGAIGDDGRLLSPTSSSSTTTTPRKTTTTTTSSSSPSMSVVTTSTTKKEGELRPIIDLSKSCLATATDLAQRSASQLLGLRKDSNARLDISKMKFLWDISLHFVLSLEQVGGSTAYVIRQCLLTQTRSFLDHLHESYKGRLVNTLDSERWVQSDVSTDRQKEIDRLASGKSFLPPQKGSATNDAASSSAAGNGGGSSGSSSNSDKNVSTSVVPSSPGDDNNKSTSTTPGSKKKDAKPARVNGATFKVVWSALLLTEIVMTYLDVSVSFSPVTMDVISKTVELLRLFDSRTRQLVLGAQAIQSAARLKSISAKHLAVTAQSIGLILALLPHVRTALLAQLPPKHHVQLTELDRISLAFIDHHGQIVAKFVGIVGDFVDQSASKLRLIDWDKFQGQCEYFEEVQRNVSALHRVLSEALPPEQVQDVFSRILALLNRRIPSHFEGIMPLTTVGKQRIIDEVVHLIAGFQKMKIIVGSGGDGGGSSSSSSSSSNCSSNGSAASAAAVTTLEDAFRKKYGSTSTTAAAAATHHATSISVNSSNSSAVSATSLPPSADL